MGDANLGRSDGPAQGRSRRDSAALLHRLLRSDLSPEERDVVASDLAELEDARRAPALERVLLDEGRPLAVREAAFDVLERLPRDDPPPASFTVWAAADDPLVRRYGLGFCRPTDEALLAASVRHTDPLVRLAALESMMSMTRTRTLVAAAASAFADPEPAVREGACRVALFDEPLPHLRPLLRAMDDRETAVRWAAYDALADYPCVAVALALSEPRRPYEDRAAWEGARSAVRTALRRARETVPHCGRARLDAWLRPVAWMLGPPDEPRTGDVGTLDPIEEADRLPSIDLRTARGALLDPETHPATLRALFFEHDWSDTGDAGRALVAAAVTSREWLARLGATAALRDLRAGPELAGLAADPDPVIARAALHSLRRIDRDDALDAARALLADERARPVAGEEALAYLARFAPRDETERALVDELARPDDRDGLFLSAAHGARRLESRACIPALLALVNAPVVGSVAAHGAALEALRSLGHPLAWIDLSALEDLDHLTIQFELAAWGHAGGRFGS